jgi:glycosyltransferase involved in cell wall biosynthesis
VELLDIRSPYVLYVGNLKPHKNVPTLLRAFSLLRSRISIPHRLVVLGDDPKGSASLAEDCRNLKISEAVSLLPRVPATVLPKLYAAADLLVMPSRVEGFGLPVLESMASGTPVICSRMASLPEVGADAALYFDPQDADELASLMETVLTSSALQADLRQRGLARARELSWKRSVDRHLEVYERVLRKS